MKKISIILITFIISISAISNLYATPTTLIWSPSTDIQPFKKIHLGYDIYAPIKSKSKNTEDMAQHNYVLQVWGPTFSLLSDNPE